LGTGADRGVDETPTTVTRLLAELEAGGQGALDELFALVYDELHALAHRQRRRWDGNDTLNTTALVHEAYVKLVDRKRVNVESRAHFFALAARAMRQILCNWARDRRTQKRGGGLEILPLDDLPVSPAHIVSSMDPAARLLALDGALRRLEERHPRQSKVVECRFFGGLTIDETASAMGIAPRTVKRDWAVAQAWLHRALETPHER
jgi:RNA polymerase sigma factor (TIGR02999 family)